MVKPTEKQLKAVAKALDVKIREPLPYIYLPKRNQFWKKKKEFSDWLLSPEGEREIKDYLVGDRHGLLSVYYNKAFYADWGVKIKIHEIPTLIEITGSGTTMQEALLDAMIKHLETTNG